MGLSQSQISLSQQLTNATLAAVANVDGTYYNGQSDDGVGATLTIDASSLTLDSVNVTLNMRVVLPAQTNLIQNGVYSVISIGSTIVLQRTYDFQCAAQIREGYFIFVSQGSTAAGNAYVVQSDIAKVGYSNINFSTKSGGSSFTVIKGRTSSYAGGSANYTTAAPGLKPGDFVQVTVSTVPTVNAWLLAATAGTDVLNLSFNIDPGATTTVNYLCIK